MIERRTRRGHGCRALRGWRTPVGAALTAALLSNCGVRGAGTNTGDRDATPAEADGGSPDGGGSGWLDAGLPLGDGGSGDSPDAGEPIDAGALDAGVDPACARHDPLPSVLQNPETLAAPRGELRFIARDQNVLSAFTHRSARFDPSAGRIVFIIHGAGRNAAGYLEAWRDAIEDAGALAIAPEWPLKLYADSEAFNLGVGTQGTPASSNCSPAEWRDPLTQRWLVT